MAIDTTRDAWTEFAMFATDDAPPLPLSLPSIGGKKITAAFAGGPISSDCGVLLAAAADRRIGLIDRLATWIPDHRDPAQITHTMADILRARVLALPAVIRMPMTSMSCAGTRRSKCLWPFAGER